MKLVAHTHEMHTKLVAHGSGGVGKCDRECGREGRGGGVGADCGGLSVQSRDWEGWG